MSVGWQRAKCGAVGISLLLTACEYIPGTDARKIVEAKEIAARDLIDPSSAQFRDLIVRGELVCGEINAKNRMGAYVGFKRFFARVNLKSSMIDPQFHLGDKFSADNLCSSLRSNPYGYGASVSACERASEKALEQIAQEIFDRSWTTECEGKTIPTPTAAPATGTSDNATEKAEDEDVAANTENEGLEDASLDADAPLVDEESNPIQVAPPAPTVKQPPDADAQWLDEVLGRNGPPRPQSDPLDPDNRAAPIEPDE